MIDEKMVCQNCGWRGPESEVKSDPMRPIAEICPKCGTDDVWIADDDEDDEE